MKPKISKIKARSCIDRLIHVWPWSLMPEDPTDYPPIPHSRLWFSHPVFSWLHQVELSNRISPATTTLRSTSNHIRHVNSRERSAYLCGIRKHFDQLREWNFADFSSLIFRVIDNRITTVRIILVSFVEASQPVSHPSLLIDLWGFIQCYDRQRH